MRSSRRYLFRDAAGHSLFPNTLYYSDFCGTGDHLPVCDSGLPLFLKRTVFPQSYAIQGIVIILAVHEPLLLKRCGALHLLLGQFGEPPIQRSVVLYKSEDLIFYFAIRMSFLLFCEPGVLLKRTYTVF